MSRPFVRMHGLGGDFVIVVADTEPFEPTPRQVRAIASRESGPGCDQLVSMTSSGQAHTRIRIWDANGDEVEYGGDAACCVAWLMMEASGLDTVTIEVGGRVMKAHWVGEGQITVDMGPPGLDWWDVPLAWAMDTKELPVPMGFGLGAPGCVAMGSPHAIFFVDDADAAPINEVGPVVETHWVFPTRANVGFAQVLARDHLRLRVWERGVGETAASGVGACAALVAAYRRNLCDREAVVALDGGELLIEWREADNHVLMTGPASLDKVGWLPTDRPDIPFHPAVQPGRTAVITGAASGIGLAAAQKLARYGLNVVMVDRDGEALARAGQTVRFAADRAAVIKTYVVDVGDYDQVLALRDRVFERFGEVAVLMNNAGVGGGGHAFQNRENWTRLLKTNLGGVLNGVQAFTEAMIDQNEPGVIINTGSKQGITTPPGDTAYNVSKAGVKVLTEGLQHTLREMPGCMVTAHLLIPGFTFTGMTRRASEKPPGAWTADQVFDFALDRLGEGDFYILCPDNDVTRAIDNKRIVWAARDITENRPPLSRWHPDWQAAFAEYMAS